MNSRTYNSPNYYEIALWHFANKKKIVNFLEECIKKFSRIRVKCILELACGSSPLVIDICKRGYRFIGLDINQRMLDYSGMKAKNAGFKIETIKADILDFNLHKRVDFAFVLYNSVYCTSNQEFVKSLMQVSNSLKKGGLYVLHMVVDGNIKDTQTSNRFIWHTKKGKVSIKGVFKRKITDYSRQLRKETLILYVNDAGNRLKLVERAIDKIIFPQEFRLLLEQTNFEFVDWFDGFDINKPFNDCKSADYVVCVIRKK